MASENVPAVRREPAGLLDWANCLPLRRSSPAHSQGSVPATAFVGAGILVVVASAFGLINAQIASAFLQLLSTFTCFIRALILLESKWSEEEIEESEEEQRTLMHIRLLTRYTQLIHALVLVRHNVFILSYCVLSIGSAWVIFKHQYLLDHIHMWGGANSHMKYILLESVAEVFALTAVFSVVVADQIRGTYLEPYFLK